MHRSKLMFWRNQEYCTPNRALKPSVSTEHEFRFDNASTRLCQEEV